MKSTYLVIILSLVFGATVRALAAPASAIILGNEIKQTLQKRYPSARIELGETTLTGLTLLSPVRRVQLIQESGQGRAEVLVEAIDGAQQVSQVRFSAMVSTFIAQRRIRPLEKLNADDFMLQLIDVAQGISHEYRTMMLAPSSDLSKLEARQTILQGQYPLTSGVQRTPDLKRGDSVRVTLLSGGIELSTSGIAQEPAYFDSPVRVLTQKTKKELMGKLLPNGTVEVRL